MSTLLERPVMVNRTVTTSIEQARAMDDPARIKIVQMLYKKLLTAAQICNHLKKSGHVKALTTVRHHLDILKESGLIEIAKIEETRGAVTKYYSTSTKLLGYNVPEDFDTKYSSAIKNTSKKLEDVLDTLAPKAILKSKQKSDPLYSQYVLMEIVNRAMTRVMEQSKTNAGKSKSKSKKSRL
ncbi:MAG: winged helix-turn-helix domain-containing protein [Nitrosopumilus sp.]|nr:winged helix-turn-helix domain-containing protein [Nitrosopumilus sp.]MDH3765522.1 winged helix-turn-helix domain-containing protein [Nitrosopumilus sp.]